MFKEIFYFFWKMVKLFSTRKKKMTTMMIRMMMDWTFYWNWKLNVCADDLTLPHTSWFSWMGKYVWKTIFHIWHFKDIGKINKNRSCPFFFGLLWRTVTVVDFSKAFNMVSIPKTILDTSQTLLRFTKRWICNYIKCILYIHICWIPHRKHRNIAKA